MELDAATRAATQEQTLGLAGEFDLENFVGDFHFIGIGGIGMSALARLLLAEGKQVSGSDQHESEITAELERLGAKIYIGHKAANVKQAAVVVISTAINTANPEMVQATELSLPILHRSAVLALLAKKSKLIAVSGTHGKTTTTGMIAQVFLDCRLDPSIVVGGIFARIGSNGHHGKGEYFIAETDESDRTHGNVHSYISVLTNIEADHLENYPGGITQIKELMTSFANQSDFAVVICADDPGCQSVLPQITQRAVTYGKRVDHADQAVELRYSYEGLAGSGMRIFQEDKMLGILELSVPGEHNKLNALAALAVALEVGLGFEPAAESLAMFSGVDRRFQIIGEYNNIVVVDDYAHHPTEVVATLQAAKQYLAQMKIGTSSRVVAVFQPHQPGRLKDLWNEFCSAFELADLVLLADVYIARGGGIENINSERLAKEINHKQVHYLGGKQPLAEQVAAYLKPGDLVLTIGAGDITLVGPDLVKRLRSQ